MDADNAPVRQAAPAQGGTVEPANRAPVAIAKFQAPELEPGERYELRDPFAEVTYRANTFPDMVAKADQLGSTRFVAVAEDGKRTPIQKVDGAWQRGEQRPAPPERPLDPGPARDEVPEAASAAPASRASKATAQPEQVDAKAVAKIDAQAERSALVARLESALMERYIIKRAPVTMGEVTIGRTEYRFRGDTSRVAFTESTFRLATDTNSPSVARSMVDVAEARNWKALRVSGNEDFKRMVWLEASVRGVKTLGYEPNPGDLEVLKREREARQVNRIEPARDASSGTAAAPAEKASARGGGGRKAVLAAIEAVLVAKKVPDKQRAAVMAAATEKLAQRIRDGQVPKVKVYDKAAPSQRPVVVPTPEMQRSRDRAAPAPVR
ncbi:LPD7 domain-containing protein [Methylibium petroleiphilum]|uniref:LPD7 domain-containing protein n=1 Tax=Methylibium petroleiphilum TaxID=105560 RepID=UPI003D2C3A74